jgi:hypothetical protein
MNAQTERTAGNSSDLPSDISRKGYQAKVSFEKSRATAEMPSPAKNSQKLRRTTINGSVQLIPINKLRRQDVRLRIEISVFQVHNGKAAVTNRTQRFSCGFGYFTVQVLLGHGKNSSTNKGEN